MQIAKYAYWPNPEKHWEEWPDNFIGLGEWESFNTGVRSSNDVYEVESPKTVQNYYSCHKGGTRYELHAEYILLQSDKKWASHRRTLYVPVHFLQFSDDPDSFVDDGSIKFAIRILSNECVKLALGG